MSSFSKAKITNVLQQILDGYVFDGTRPDRLEYSADSLAKNADVHISMLPTILDRLETREVIKTYGESGDDFVVTELTYTILFTDDFRKRAEAYLELLGISKQGAEANRPQRIILYLEADGNFWHGDKKKFCYPMGAGSRRFLTLKYLREHEGYQAPSDIASILGSKSTQGVRTEIKKIRNNIKKYLGIEGDQVIESKKDSGYRINPDYHIAFQKD